MLKLVGSLKTRGFRVGWMLEELGLEHEHVDAMPRSEALLAADWGGKVPVLETDEGVIWDSVAILTYLTDREGRFTHAPGSFARARQDAVTHQINDELNAVLWAAARHSFILPEAERVPEVKPSLKLEFARNMERMAKRLGDEAYLAGAEPTVPDFLLAHIGNWARNAGFETGPAAIEAHHGRMTARLAYAAVMERRG